MEDRRHCCKIGCPKSAEYQIWFGYTPKPDDFTESCLEHIPDLLTDAPRFEIIVIEGARGTI